MSKFGRSVYLSEYSGGNLPENCDFYFTSFHIAEEFNEDFKDNAFELIKRMKETGKKVITDLSPRGLKALDYDTIREFVKDYPVDYIRYDFGFSKDEIIEGSRYVGTVVNASTCELDFTDALKGKILAIHNFYPRKETGLDRDYFNERNRLFKEKNIPIGAFIASDITKRGPLFEGLSTLEEHRFIKPYIQYLDLSEEVDFVIVGDGGLSEKEEDLISSLRRDGVIYLPSVLDEKSESYYGKVFTCRIDSPKWLLRAKESREYATQGPVIQPYNCIQRKRGSITLDNKEYQRYSGELQVMKTDLKADEKVNVIGKVQDEYIKALDYIERGKRFCFVKGEI